MMIDLNQTCYAKLPIVDFRKNELRKAVVSFTPLEIMPRCSLRARGPPSGAEAPLGRSLGRRLQRGYISD